MNKKQLLLLVLIVSLIAYLINSGYVSIANQEKISSDWEHLETYHKSFSVKDDLNNDGQEEEIAIFRQWDGEGWYSDDSWYILRIIDKAQNIVYGKDVSYFQIVEGLSVIDVDGDGFKEILVLLNPTKYWDHKTCIYGWKDNKYGFISEKN